MKKVIFSRGSNHVMDIENMDTRCLDLLNYGEKAKDDLDLLNDNLTDTTSFSSNLLLQHKEISELFQPDDKWENSSIQLLEKEKKAFFKQKQPSTTNVNNDLLKIRSQGLLWSASGTCSTEQLKSVNNQGRHKIKPIGNNCIQKNTKNKITISMDSVFSQEISLESMGLHSDGSPWTSIRIPKRKELQETLQHRIKNFVNPDIILVIDNHEFFCHRIVLQSYSDYFDSMSSLDAPNVIHVDERVTKNAFITIYLWMLSAGQDGHDCIKKSSIVEVLVAAEILGIKEEQCNTFIQNDELFIEENAFSIITDAIRWGKQSIKRLMVSRIHSFFLPLVSSLDFIQLNAEDLCLILESDNIVVHCELEVFMAAIRWLKADWEDRRKDLKTVMKCVRFGLMTPSQLVNIRKNPESPEILEITKDKHVQNMIEDGLAYAVKNILTENKNEQENICNFLKLIEPNKRNFTSTSKDYRTYKEFLDYLHEIKTNPTSFEMKQSYISPQNKMSERILNVTNSENCIAISKSTISVLKNEKPEKSIDSHNKPKDIQCDENSVLVECKKCQNSFKRISLKESAATVIQSVARGFLARKKIHLMNFNVKSSREEKIKKNYKKYEIIFKSVNTGKENSMIKDTLSHEESEEKILVFEGLNPCQSEHTSGKCAVFRYDSKFNKWDIISYIPKPRYYHCAAKLRGKIYIVGGRYPRNVEKCAQSLCAETLSFDPSTNQWKEEAPLITPRHSFGLASLHGFLYVIGGEGMNGRILSSAERYNPEAGMWEQIKPLPQPCIGAAVCCYRGSIWVVGGMSSYKQPTNNLVYCYDPEDDVWVRQTHLRFGRAFAALVNLKETLYVVGGATGNADKIESTDIIEAWENEEWTFKTNMSVPRHGHTVAVLKDKMLIIGGTSSKYGRTLNQVDTWCVKTNQEWNIQISPLPAPIIGHCSVSYT
ncbi:uncharacterized protein LOC106661392 isoform X2 [Cimex lectularius]|uniref:BTB domain-containing protein n=1 Tax=Cimex lectularius TaxID=79782 RepID=A0A8I6R825_CIMLE|nr:uncharacterized protein LOC106661392 isoform X2 [Cimex lectularius]